MRLMYSKKAWEKNLFSISIIFNHLEGGHLKPETVLKSSLLNWPEKI